MLLKIITRTVDCEFYVSVWKKQCVDFHAHVAIAVGARQDHIFWTWKSHIKPPKPAGKFELCLIKQEIEAQHNISGRDMGEKIPQSNELWKGSWAATSKWMDCYKSRVQESDTQNRQTSACCHERQDSSTEGKEKCWKPNKYLMSLPSSTFEIFTPFICRAPWP